MSLADIVSRVIDATQDHDGSVNTHAAVVMGVPLVKADDEAVDQCISEALAVRIKSKATREEKKSRERPGDHPDLFGLRPRHALDIEGGLALGLGEGPGVQDLHRPCVSEGCARQATFGV